MPKALGNDCLAKTFLGDARKNEAKHLPFNMP